MRYLLIIVFFAVLLLVADESLKSQSFRVTQIPHGSKFSCATCHVSAGGGGTLTPFGQDVELTLQGGNVNWNAALASKDSDGDGFTNGAELQDPNGTWKVGQQSPGSAASVSNPGLASSIPVSNEYNSDGSIVDFVLSANYPNPFNPSTTLEFIVPKESTVSLVIFSVNGEKIKELTNAVYSIGKHKLSWDGTNDAGVSVPSGVYLYRIEAGSFSETKSMILLK